MNEIIWVLAYYLWNKISKLFLFLRFFNFKIKLTSLYNWAFLTYCWKVNFIVILTFKRIIKITISFLNCRHSSKSFFSILKIIRAFFILLILYLFLQIYVIRNYFRSIFYQPKNLFAYIFISIKFFYKNFYIYKIILSKSIILYK